MNAVSSSLTPITIFSNLLNAYATIDSKHDITEKLINTATSLLGGGGGGDDSGEEEDKERSVKSTTSSTRFVQYIFLLRKINDHTLMI